MATGFAHYLFGELQQVNETRVVPGTARALKSWLDSWLPQWVQSAEEAEPRFEHVGDRCRAWQTGDRRAEVGVISLPLADAPKLDGVRFTHLICRVYFNWASAGRVSRTGHAVLLTADQWLALGYNPFRLPHLVNNSAAFASSAALDFEGFETSAQTPTDRSVDAQRVAPWRSQLVAIWQGSPPVRLPADAPPWLYDLLLTSLPPERRATVSCVCGPFGLRQRFQQLIDFAAGTPLSSSRPTNAVECMRMLDSGESIEGCWDASWVSMPLGIPSPAAPVAPTPAAPGPPPTAPSAPSLPSVTIGHAGHRKGARLILWLGIAVVLLGAGAYWGLVWSPQQRIEDRCAAWVQDLKSEKKRFNETRELLVRAEELLKLDPDRQACPELAGVGALIGLYHSRFAGIESKPVTDADIPKINRLNADLIALAALPQVLASDGSRYATLLSGSDRLYRLAVEWVGEPKTSQYVRARYKSLRDDMDEQGLATNPYLTDIETQLRELEQQEAFSELQSAAKGVDPLDRAGLEAVRKLSEDFRAHYPRERKDEVADLLNLAALRYENGARQTLYSAQDDFQQDPTADHLFALKAAVANYLQDMSPARELAAEINEMAVSLERLQTDTIVHVSLLQQHSGKSVEIGRLVGPGHCQPQADFQLFSDLIVCVRVIPMDRRHERGALESKWLKPFAVLLESLRDWIATGKLYEIRLLDLLRVSTWQSRDVILRAEIDWPLILSSDFHSESADTP